MFDSLSLVNNYITKKTANKALVINPPVILNQIIQLRADKYQTNNSSQRRNQDIYFFEVLHPHRRSNSTATHNSCISNLFDSFHFYTPSLCFHNITLPAKIKAGMIFSRFCVSSVSFGTVLRYIIPCLC